MNIGGGRARQRPSPSDSEVPRVVRALAKAIAKAGRRMIALRRPQGYRNAIRAMGVGLASDRRATKGAQLSPTAEPPVIVPPEWSPQVHGHEPFSQPVKSWVKTQV
jgi:hypothetical protein